MTEDHQIVGESHGEPLPAGRVGVRVQLQLSGCPSGRWSNTLSANLYTEFLGHPAVGHLRLDEIVQGDQIVLDGVEASEAPTPRRHAPARGGRDKQDVHTRRRANCQCCASGR